MWNLSKRSSAFVACLALAALTLVHGGIAMFGGPPWP
jgi:hypothetical protein